MDRPPKDAVAALGRVTKRYEDHLRTTEQWRREGFDDEYAQLIEEELAALRWALGVAREMEDRA